jgi:hypothetical protein
MFCGDQEAFPMPRVGLLALFALCALTGCFNPFTTRVPQLASKGSEYERRESQIQDPYPDRNLGPDPGFRPLGFQDQRSEVQLAKDRSYAGFIRTQATVRPPVVQPGAPVYPNSVPGPTFSAPQLPQ